MKVAEYLKIVAHGVYSAGAIDNLKVSLFVNPACDICHSTEPDAIKAEVTIKLPDIPNGSALNEYGELQITYPF